MKKILKKFEKQLALLRQAIEEDWVRYDTDPTSTKTIERDIIEESKRIYPLNTLKQQDLVFVGLAAMLLSEDIDNPDTVREDILIPLAVEYGVVDAYVEAMLTKLNEVSETHLKCPACKKTWKWPNEYVGTFRYCPLCGVKLPGELKQDGSSGS